MLTVRIVYSARMQHVRGVVASLVGAILLLFLLWVPTHPVFERALDGASRVSRQPPLHVLFGGDIMLDRSLRTAADAKGGDSLFACLDPLLVSADLAIANLEGPITPYDSVSVGSLPGDGHNYTFTFPLSSAGLLASHRIAAVSLGNNHITNFGWDGVRSTMHALDAAQVGHFGDPISHGVYEASRGDIRIAIIGYNQFDPVGWRVAADTALTQIAREKSLGFMPVVFSHWGDEYSPATDGEKTLAHAFVDAGAVLVVGAHPHVVQEHEMYHDAPIYYSLGNLIFDQYWEYAVSHGLMIEATFDQGRVTGIEEIPIELRRDRTTCPVG